MLSGHGNDIYDYPGKIQCDFSSNIPYRNGAGVIANYLKQQMDNICHYPDPHANVLTALLAARHAVSPNNILVTNGSAEAFYLLAHLFAGKKSTIAYPAFAEYEDACRIHRHRLTFIPLSDLSAATESAPTTLFKNKQVWATKTANETHTILDTGKIIDSNTVWLAVPNNPDGRIMNYDAIDQLCQKNPATTFIIDTAYQELCPQCQSLDALHDRHDNLITVHSLTKTFGIPGLRLGYLIASKNIIDGLQQLRMPWSVNTLALSAGEFILKNQALLMPDVELLCDESQQLQQELGSVEELEVIPSPCNFFLVKMKRGTAAALKQYLIKRFGLLIRDAANFRGLTPQHFRVSVQEGKWNRELIHAIKCFFLEEEKG